MNRRIILLFLALFILTLGVSCHKGKRQIFSVDRHLHLNQNNKEHSDILIAVPNSNKIWLNRALLGLEIGKRKRFHIGLFFGDDTNQMAMNRAILNFVEKGIQWLIVSPIDDRISPILGKLQEKGIKIIMLESYPESSDNFNLYLTPDNSRTGEILAKYIIDKLDIAHVQNKVFHLVMMRENNPLSLTLYGQALATFQPYIQQGKLIIINDNPKDALLEESDSPHIRRLLNQSLAKLPPDTLVDVVLSPKDNISNVVSSYFSEIPSYRLAFPLITGQEANPRALDDIREEKQDMTLYKSDFEIMDTAIKVILHWEKEEEAPFKDIPYKEQSVNPRPSQARGRVIPAFYFPPVVVSRNNLGEFINLHAFLMEEFTY